MTPTELREHLLQLKRRRSPRYGSFGEHIYKKYMAQFCTVEPVHSSGTDFMVDGDRVDVKTQCLLDGKRARGVPPSKQLDGIVYEYVLFKPHGVIITDHHRYDQSLISWDEVAKMWDEWDIGDRKHGTTLRIDEKVAAAESAADLHQWIKQNWGAKAKVIYRNGRAAQESMMERGWGPEAFYCDDVSVDIVVCVFFDQGECWKVHAYHMAEFDEIKWVTKPVGEHHRMCYDPRGMSDKFVFEDIEDFKRRFLTWPSEKDILAHL